MVEAISQHKTIRHFSYRDLRDGSKVFSVVYEDGSGHDISEAAMIAFQKLEDPTFEPMDPKETTPQVLCAFCNLKPVAYPGAIYCGAACCARAEAGEKP